MKKITLLFSFLVILFTSCGSSPLSKAKQANEDIIEAAKNNDLNAYRKATEDYINAVCECETWDEFKTITEEVTQVDPVCQQFVLSLPYEEQKKLKVEGDVYSKKVIDKGMELSKEIRDQIVEDAVKDAFNIKD